MKHHHIHDPAARYYLLGITFISGVLLGAAIVAVTWALLHWL